MSSESFEFQEEMEKMYEELYELVGVRPVKFGFGFVQKGNPSTITFEEAMEHVLNYAKTQNVINMPIAVAEIQVGDKVVHNDENCWIGLGSKGIVVDFYKSSTYATYVVDFVDGNAAGRKIECCGYNLTKY